MSRNGSVSRANPYGLMSVVHFPTRQRNFLFLYSRPRPALRTVARLPAVYLVGSSTTLSVSRLYSIGWYAYDNFEMIWKEVVVAKSTYYLGIRLKGLKKTTKYSVGIASVSAYFQTENLQNSSYYCHFVFRRSRIRNWTQKSPFFLTQGFRRFPESPPQLK
jgi:hypothetical protein